MKRVRNEDLGITSESTIVNAPDDDVTAPDGSRLTTESAEKLANEAIRRGWSNLVPGGKSLSGSGKHSPVLQVRLPEATRDRLHERALKEGVSDSKVARAAIEAYLQNAS